MTIIKQLFQLKLTYIINFIVIILFSCNSGTRSNNNDSFNSFFDKTLVDGFDYPVGDINGKGSYKSFLDGRIYNSWKISTYFGEKYSLGIHTGLDFNGTGGGNTDINQPVYSIGKGKVIDSQNYGAPWGNIVLIEHRILINAEIRTCYSLYAHLNLISVKKGDFVEKREKIGTIGTGDGSYAAHLHLEIRKEAMKDFATTYWPSSNGKDLKWVKDHYYDPDLFIKSQRKITLPSNEKNIIIVIKNKYKMRYYSEGKLQKEYDIALSQQPEGHKQKEGDLKLPEGEYYICEKLKGPFKGAYAEYLGKYMLRISYPNKMDAENAFENGTITVQQKEQILKANRNHTIPPKNTYLGGGITIHGWKGEWSDLWKRDLTWGCISMHNPDLEQFFKMVDLKTKILIHK